MHHSFSLSLQAQKVAFQQILATLDFCYLPSRQCDWTGPIMVIGLFLVSDFNFLFVVCGGLSWLPVSFLLHVKYTVSYRISQVILPASFSSSPPSSCTLCSSVSWYNTRSKHYYNSMHNIAWPTHYCTLAPPGESHRHCPCFVTVSWWQLQLFNIMLQRKS